MEKEKTNESIMTTDSVNAIFNEVGETLIKKNADYGGASFDLGLIGNMVHIHDKESRFRNLVHKEFTGQQPNFESLEDTLKDLIGYCVIGLHILKNRKEDEKANY